MLQKRIIISVTNDLVTDQRLKRHCGALYDEGYDILLTGRLLKESLPLEDRPYRTRRVRHWFNKGFLFYAEYNTRLFFFLLFAPCDILHSNDLDTLPANYLISRLRARPLVFDSHEYFTEVPELTRRPVVRKIWETLESVIFPKLRYIITVNRSIALAYRKKYKKEVHIVRNVPERINEKHAVSRKLYSLPENKKLIIMQGAGINRDRGAEEAVEAMQYIENAVLVIAGKGDILPELKRIVSRLSLQERICFINTLPYKELMRLTMICDCGLSLDKDSNLNYRYSLPNKLFDYIMAGIPVVVSDLPELRHIVEKYQIGLVTGSVSPKGIAEKVNCLLYGTPVTNWKVNLKLASDDLNWDKEKHVLISLYRKIQ
jgi:glycosyltransferase involved in cell wall biosynthesis